MIRQQLPPGLRGLYRLVLRTSSASVLHARPAAPRLRATWRPTFDEAARMAQTAQGSPLTEEGAKAAAQAKDWLEKWEKRMDNTLLLLYNSAVSRGLAHKLTRNLATLSSLRKAWLCSAYERPGAPWNPTGKQMHARTKKSRDRKNELGESAWNMVREVVRMAEGRDRLVLGLPTPPQRKTYRDHE